jgi:dTDP-4-dehydrorhamnose 3,5-epimerase
MQFIQTELPGIVLIEPTIFGDDRGYFMEVYHAQNFQESGINASFMQDNQSGSKQGTLRGLHYQIRHPQGKLVRVITGEVFDVAVDIRRSSATLGKWFGTRLSAENKRQIWIPVGFAHGIFVLSEWAELLYKVSDYYAPEWERTISWDDPVLGIHWPLKPGVQPILSDKDRHGLPLEKSELYD